jgi:hypothetical protein
MATGAEPVLGQDRLFYCTFCNILFLSEGDAREHESVSGHGTVEPAIVQT